MFWRCLWGDMNISQWKITDRSFFWFFCLSWSWRSAGASNQWWQHSDPQRRVQCVHLRVRARVPAARIRPLLRPGGGQGPGGALQPLLGSLWSFRLLGQLISWQKMKKSHVERKCICAWANRNINKSILKLFLWSISASNSYKQLFSG